MLKLTHTADSFSVSFNNQLRLFHHNSDLPLLFFGEGKAEYKEHLGSFKIKENLLIKHAVSNFSLIHNEPSSIIIQFTLDSDLIQMKIADEANRMEISFHKIPSKYNRFWINLPASPNEAIYGGGEQFSEFNLAHQKVPLWVQEQGVGRKGFTAFVANVAAGAGGSKFHTYYPQPTFVSLDYYYVHVDQSAYGEMDFHHGTSPRPYHQLHFWQIPEGFFIGVHQNFMETVSALNKFLGLQPKLPDWVFSGMWLAIQGENGLDGVRSRLQMALDAGVEVSAIWSQDWQGILKTSFGTQLFWDWKWDGPNRKIRFPNFPDFVKEVREKGIRYLGYMNPYLYERGALFQEAKEKGYLVKTKAGDVCITKSTTFNFGILDLTNPEVSQWTKSVIKKNLIQEAGLSGWMADFGEYLPIDVDLASGENPEKIHNQYPVLWDKVNLEAIEEAGKSGEIVYFTRSGYSYSSRYTTLVWAGDQMVNWEYHDGLASVIPAALSLGMCGIGYHCSDIGGFTSLSWIKRSKEVFLRWVEQATFTMIMRTHESNRPEKCWQFDSDQETLDHLARMTKIHKDLTPYLQSLSNEYQATGIPPIRPLVLHYPGDKRTISIKYQYLLGQDLLVAPVLKKNKKKWKLYLPNDSWVHLWSEDEYTGGTITIEAPWGYPPIFYRKESKFIKIFSEIAKRFGLYSL